MSRFRQLMIANQGSKYPDNATVWEVTIPEGGAEYSFQVESGLAWNNAWNGQPFIVDWGDGSMEDVGTTATVARITPIHTYTTAGAYRVSATGQQENIQLGRANDNYGKFVTGFIQASSTLTRYQSMLSNTMITQLPSNFTIPQRVTNTLNMLTGTRIAALPPQMRLHEGITNANGFLAGSSIQYLPEGFTIPDSTASQCSRIITRCSRLLRLPESFRIPSAATDLSQFLYGNSKLAYIPKEFRIPAGVTRLDFFATGTGSAKDVNIAELLAAWSPTSGNINIGSAFEASSISGIAPADKLWKNPLSETWTVLDCFLRAFNIENLGKIPPLWGGAKIIFENTTIESSAEVNALLLEKYVNIARFYGLYGVKVEFTGLPTGLQGSWYSDNYYLQGTLAVGTYQFTAHVYNDYNTTGVTATITLVVS